MQPYELIRNAAKIIETNGWAGGVDETGGAVAARDASGNPIRLLDIGIGGDSRARVSRKAVAFSAYGAMVKAQELYGEPTHVGLMWDTLYRLARELGDTPEGGSNFVHPIIQYNQAEGRTKEEVLAFLEQAATAIEMKLHSATVPATLPEASS